jgi:hypothetical protein
LVEDMADLIETAERMRVQIVALAKEHDVQVPSIVDAG